MNNKVTLDKWMASVWLVPVEGAEKYHLGQRLNKKEANEIIVKAQEDALALISEIEKKHENFKEHELAELKHQARQLEVIDVDTPTITDFKVGDEVLRGTLLFEVTGNNAKFSFQILENGNYVNPMDLMEIHG
jgi:hypothetical protein